MAYNNNKPDGDFIRIQDLFFIFLHKWYWFVVSIAIALLIAFYYLATTSPVYTRTASLLVKDNSKSGTTTDNAAFDDLGIFKSNTNIINELHSLKSPALMTEVVRRLNLDYSYSEREKLRTNELYNLAPISIRLFDINENQSIACNVELLSGNKYILSDFIFNDTELNVESIKGSFNDSITTPYGLISIEPTALYSPDSAGRIIRFTKSGLSATAKEFNTALNAILTDEKSSIIDLTISDVSIQRAEDVLNELIEVYNENWIEDKNKMAKSTSEFIKGRLEKIEGELGNVDDNISSYKSKHLLPDVQAASGIVMAQSNENKKRIQELEIKLVVTRDVLNRFRKADHSDELIPSNGQLENSNIERLISEYNTILLQRNSLLKNSSERNPLVMDLSQSLAAIRQNIINSLENAIASLNTQINNVYRINRQTDQQIASNPTQAMELLSAERQQKVKESLYLYLLQKREENELSQAFTAYNTKIINSPSGSYFPTAPKKKNILLVALAVGLMIPAVILFLIETMNTKVRSKDDLNGLSIPYIGEIPLMEKNKKAFLGKKKEDSHQIAVKEKSHDRINEAFRILRTNIDFMRGNLQDNKVIMMTSFNPGSGKTFTTINLAKSLALTGKRVIAVDLDIRKASLSMYVDSPKQGITNYLAGITDNVDELIIKGIDGSQLDVLPVGVFPPNPTELLLNPRMEILLNSLKETYDCILLDCTPVEIVADAAIVGKYAGVTVFVVRVGLMDRRMLPELDEIYGEKKYNNMAVVVNGVNYSVGRYGYSKYGYSRYGYHYGHGY